VRARLQIDALLKKAHLDVQRLDVIIANGIDADAPMRAVWGTRASNRGAETPAHGRGRGGANSGIDGGIAGRIGLERHTIRISSRGV